jgi:site-specific DNA recombinase
MTAKSVKPVRCAIYTRVSTELRLEQDFNSLDAQYEASRAYIRSQAFAGWSLVRSRYDDGGYSGASTDRPALQRLLIDVRARRVDVIIVYKVDRLTRSLADFAKLVELFDAHDVSFVSVTQQFNTTTSMGRLTLNVLLSFAQFEREVTSERIRDKIAASKRKGLWVGGMVPLGYQTKNRKISVNEREAKRVRTIFRLYLKLSSIDRLMVELRKRKLFTKVRTTKSGRIIGGGPFTRGPLAHLLRNRFYVAEIAFKNEVLPGEQPAIVDRDLFNRVQSKLDEQLNNHKTKHANSDSMLTGLIFDNVGNRMTPTHARKGKAKYRYYISLPLVQGQSKQVGSVHRVPAPEIEEVVARAVRKHLDVPTHSNDKKLVKTSVARIEVQSDHLAIQLKPSKELPPAVRKTQKAPTRTLTAPWHKGPSRKRREIIIPKSISTEDAHPIRANMRARLIAAIARGRRWLNEFVSDPKTTPEIIANREACSVRSVNMTISLAFLAPSLVKAAIEGRLPYGFGPTRLSDLPAEWTRQYEALGLPTQ